MILSDNDIIDRVDSGDIGITPFNRDNVEPASVDLRLGEDFKIVELDVGPKWVPWTLRKKLGKLYTAFGWGPSIDIKEQDDSAFHYTETTGDVTIPPGTFVLATTKERVELPDDVAANVLGRSSLGRIGISVHQTAGFVDNGFEGTITLELSNHGPAPVTLYENQRICQIVFKELTSPSDVPYGHEGSQYQNQTGATTSGMRFD